MKKTKEIRVLLQPNFAEKLRILLKKQQIQRILNNHGLLTSCTITKNLTCRFHEKVMGIHWFHFCLLCSSKHEFGLPIKSNAMYSWFFTVL